MLFCCVADRSAIAQDIAIEYGAPFEVRHYSDRDYKAYFQNWSIVQDDRGILYAANRDGVLRFDGRNWSLIKTKKKTTVRSLAVDSDNVVYLGEMGDFGYLEADSLGRENFVSLLQHVPLEHQIFNDIWATLAIDNTVYFQSSGHIFRWDGNKVKVWKSDTGFHTAFIFDGSLYVRERQIGLKRLDGDEFALAPNGSRFAESKIYGLLPYDDHGSYLVATREDGIYVLNGDSIFQLNSEINEYLRTYRLYCSTKLSNNLYAFGTLRGGVVITDKDGKILYHIGQPTISDDVIRFLYPDQEDGLWIATSSDGLFRVQLPFVLSKFSRPEGIQGNINTISRVNGRIVVGTLTGAFSMTDSKSLDAKFEQIVSLPATWQISNSHDDGLAATEEGTFSFKHGKVIQIDKRQSYSVQPLSQGGVKRILSGGDSNIFVFRQTRQGSYGFETSINFTPLVRSIVPLGDNVWIGTRANGVIRLQYNELYSTDEFAGLFNATEYSSNSGLPSNTTINITQLGSKPIFYSAYGPYRFVESTERFELVADLWPFQGSNGDSLFVMSEDRDGSVWMAFPDSIVKAVKNPAGRYNFEAPKELKFEKTSTSSILVEESGVVWFNDGDELIRYDPSLHVGTSFLYNAIISQVSINSQPEPIFSGAFRTVKGGMTLEQPDWMIPTLRFDEKDLIVGVSATNFHLPSETRFQIRIDGRDTDWSPWTDRVEYTITGLSEGRYTFRVRAKNIAGDLSREAIYTFIILPPFYRTWWAYLLYLAIGGLIVYSGRKYYVMALAHKLAAEQAEELAREREVNKVLQEANERLTKANRLKDEFLATTSHELRTPLTAILGFTSVLREEIPKDADYREFLDIIEESGSRLMETLNSLLDLAKLRAGMMEINLEICDLYYQCNNGISGLKLAAERKGLELMVERPSETIFAELDVIGFLRILQNLVGNAIKFTDSGYVKIVLELDDDLVHVRVRDSGIGIDEEFLPRLFDEFMQESDGPSRSYEGFGLGLAITARLVQLMHGKISVESKKSEGSQFTVTLPRAEPITGEPISVSGFGNVNKES